MRYPSQEEQLRHGHHIEQNDGWEYRRTNAFERDHPDGWDFQATRPDGFELNTDLGVSYDGEIEGHELVEPGVVRIPRAASGVLLVAHWRRKMRGRR